MPATFTADIFSTVDGFGAPQPGTWGGYWNKEGAELLDHRLAQYSERQRLVLGANTYELFARFERLRASNPEFDKVGDPWVTRMLSLPTTVVSTTLEEPLAWPGATVARGDAVEVVRRLKQESELPLRSHGSIALNRALLDAGLVDRLQLTIFPVITGQTGAHPIFKDVADFDLELLDSRTFDGGVQELTYRPTRHV
jgi:dihydrofolate reductase